jgi:hypothetical protein
MPSGYGSIGIASLSIELMHYSGPCLILWPVSGVDVRW